MLTIDGSEGEGGGQILRTSLALRRRAEFAADPRKHTYEEES